jgi:cytosine/adenosine deaminase-related metal-dependent hydrolase
VGTILVRNADHIITMASPAGGGAPEGGPFPGGGVPEGGLFPGGGLEFGPGDVLIDDHRVSGIFGPLSPDRPHPDRADRVIDASGKLVLPGLVNTHHHFFQVLTRNLPIGQNDRLFDWLVKHYPIWEGVTGEMVEVSAQAAIGELLLSGCTCTTDHHYLFPSGAPGDLIDRQIRAAVRMGIRFHPTRGSMEVGASRGGLPPDSLTQSSAEILRDSRRIIEAHHDPSPFSMCRVALAPCAPFSISEELMRATASVAREYGLRLHTHLGETLEEERYCLRTHGCRPFELARRLGWIAGDVWLAHAVHFDDAEIAALAAAGVGVAHCPASNLRLGSGVMPLRRMLDAGVAVGLGVDGSASNDSSNLLADLRVALYAHRLGQTPTWVSPREVLDIATRGGARVLGRDDIGVLAPGKAADLVLIDLDQLAYVGTRSDPIAALVLTTPIRPVHTSIVNGRVVVENGRLAGADETELSREAHRLSMDLLRRL